MKVLLVEPKSSTTYPPMGLMKISRYHKLRGDDVTYVVGKDKRAFSDFWDKIYVTSVFTYDYENLKKTISYYSQNLFNFNNMIVGGVAASLLPEMITKETGVQVHEGLLDEHDPFLEKLASKDPKYGYLLSCAPTIDNLPPDYSLTKDNTKHSKITDNAFFLYSTKGCPNNCGFCAVKKLEPTYVDYIPIKDRIEILREEVGDRAGLLFLDNNIAASDKYFDIIDEIIDCGYGADEKMKYKKNGRTIYKNRFVDFNQGVDLRLLDKKKMHAISRIAINPLRLAFDDISLADQYKEKSALAVDSGINKLSNYMLFNYKDKPEDLYGRLEINTNLIKHFEKDSVKIFSFPMRYSPIGQTDRLYVGKHWSRRKIRAIQLVLNATHGIVSHSLKQYNDGEGYFYRAFGRNVEEFLQIITMPFHYIINRDAHEYSTDKIAQWKEEYNKLSKLERNELDSILSNGRYKGNGKHPTKVIQNILKHYVGEHARVE